MPATRTIRNTLDFVMTKPSLTKVLGNPITGLGGLAVPINIAQRVVEEMLQEPFSWKWNRREPAPFVTNQLQQDYSTSITDLAWIDGCTRTEMNNPSFAPPSPPTSPQRGVEVVRELFPCSIPGIPNQICWIPNSLAICGTWQAGLTYTNPGASTQMPIQYLMQIRDPNGNIQVLTGFGTTGTTEPVWNTTANGTTTDGTCTWTMADPNGITWRLSPLPPNAGLPYLIQPYYQMKAPVFTSVNNLWTIPDDLSNVYEMGFTAYSYDAGEDEANFEKKYQLFMVRLKKAVQAGDREPESFGMFPSRSLTGVVGTMTRGDEQYPPGLFE